MSELPQTPTAWVQVAQALIARELVESFGLPERHAAARLGVAPSAVSQYLSGKRLRTELAGAREDPDVARIARAAAQQLVSQNEAALPAQSWVLETALELCRRTGGRRAASPSRKRPAVPSEALRRSLKARVAGEQAAVADCMRLAQRSRDELTRAIFRQIASDSLRHAEIVASLGTYLDRGVTHTVASGITLLDVDRLIAREHAAEATQTAELPGSLRGVMRLLWESMEADERKHDALLERLRTPELLGPTRDDGPRRRSARAGSFRG